MTRQRFQYDSLPVHDRRLLDVVDEVRKTHRNGGCYLYWFVPTSPELWDGFDAQQGGPQDWLRALLESASVRDATAVRIPYPLPLLPEHTLLAAHEFENAMTDVLARGGAYHAYQGTKEQARRMSRRFVSAMLGEQPESAITYRLCGPWTPWFYDVAWDDTFIVLNRAERRWALFCVTDTD